MDASLRLKVEELTLSLASMVILNSGTFRALDEYLPDPDPIPDWLAAATDNLLSSLIAFPPALISPALSLEVRDKVES
jgi:hypothetical protein